MSKPEEFSTYASLDSEGLWIAFVVRRKTSAKNYIEFEKPGFTSQQTALSWADDQLAFFVEQRKTQPLYQANLRREKRKREQQLSHLSLNQLADQALIGHVDCQSLFELKVMALWNAIVYSMMKSGNSEMSAFSSANARVGSNFQESIIKALSGFLDVVAFTQHQFFLVNQQLTTVDLSREIF